MLEKARPEVSSGPLFRRGAVTIQKMKKIKFKVDKHILTPKHLKLSEKEKTQLFEKYHVTSKEMPKILSTDAALRELDAKPGDVVKILRKSPTAGEAAFYRVVMNV